MGAHSWARSIARALRDQGLPVLLVDTDLEKVDAARAEGFAIYHGSIISEDTLEELELDGIECLLALTYNDEVNALAALHFAEVFGRANVYQLAPRTSAREVPRYLRGRILFGPEMTYTHLSELFSQGASIQAVQGTPELDPATVIPLFVVTANKKVLPFTLNRAPRPQPGDTLIVIVKAK